MSNETNSVEYGSIAVDGITVAYREAGNRANPKLVLLHGFPSSSHQHRDLIRALSHRFHLIAPDYPGFGLSDTPDPATFAYTFDRIAEFRPPRYTVSTRGTLPSKSTSPTSRSTSSSSTRVASPSTKRSRAA